MAEGDDGRPRAEEPLDAAFLSRVVNSLPMALFVKDRAYRYVLANDALRAVAGDADLALEGRTDHEVFDKELADLYRERDELMFTSGAEVVVDEEIFVDAQGHKRVIATTKVPLRGAGGDGTHLIGVVHDITDLKRAEESLRTINEGLEVRVRDRTRELEATQAVLLRKERLAVVGELASALAHQIRNPLGAISNATYVLSRALSEHPDPNVARAIEIVHEEAWRANRIIGDLLDYARIRPAVRARANVPALVGRALFGLRTPEEVEVVTELAEPLPAVYVDEEQVARALSNLLRSAVESAGPRGEVAVRGTLDGGHVVLSILDASAPDDLPEELAGPPSEPDVPSSPKPLDVALGLATARALVENQGGTVELSPEGARPSFVVRLPLDVRERADSVHEF